MMFIFISFSYSSKLLPQSSDQLTSLFSQLIVSSYGNKNHASALNMANTVTALNLLFLYQFKNLYKWVIN
jgi:hypothetical protein